MKSLLAICYLSSATLAFAASTITPVEAQRLLDAGQKVTFVDVRSNTAFKVGHVPGAINVPAALVSQKQLPPLGAVIVYDDGLGRDTASEAASALGGNPGIKPQVLEGGFAAWESARSATTKAPGLKPEETPFITYADLSKTQSDDVVIVDLRKEPKQSRQGDDGQSVTPSEPLTDLRKEFGKVRGVTRSPFDVPQSRQGAASSGAAPLLVLIDNGDGSAQATARTLKANGITRYAILAGGEQVVARKGRPGTGRASSTMVVRRPSGASNTSTNR